MKDVGDGPDIHHEGYDNDHLQEMFLEQIIDFGDYRPLKSRRDFMGDFVEFNDGIMLLAIREYGLSFVVENVFHS